MNEENIGSNFDEFLKDEGIFEEVEQGTKELIQKYENMNPLQQEEMRKEFLESMRDNRWYGVRNARKYRSNRQYPSKHNGDVYVSGGEINWKQVQCKCKATKSLVKAKKEDVKTLGEYICNDCLRVALKG